MAPIAYDNLSAKDAPDFHDEVIHQGTHKSVMTRYCIGEVTNCIRKYASKNHFAHSVPLNDI